MQHVSQFIGRQLFSLHTDCKTSDLLHCELQTRYFFELTQTLLGTGAGGFPGEWRVGMTGAARGVWAGVLGSLLLISPAEAEAEPDAAPFPPAGRVGCYRNKKKKPLEIWIERQWKDPARYKWLSDDVIVAIMEVAEWMHFVQTRTGWNLQ